MIESCLITFTQTSRNDSRYQFDVLENGKKFLKFCYFSFQLEKVIFSILILYRLVRNSDAARPEAFLCMSSSEDNLRSLFLRYHCCQVYDKCGILGPENVMKLLP